MSSIDPLLVLADFHNYKPKTTFKLYYLTVFCFNRPMAKNFSQKTYQYFKLAEKNKNNKKWFEQNKNFYKEHVREPFEYLINQLNKELKNSLPRIDINPRSITRPQSPINRAQNGIVKSHSHVSLAEKRTSLFEWNPGIYIHFGNGKEDNILGLGLYMVSGRQMSLLRNKLVEDFENIDAILSDRKLKKIWGKELPGEKFKRFPKGYNPDDPRTKYLWNKQFFLFQRYLGLVS